MTGGAATANLPNGGLYHLVIDLSEGCVLTVGALGRIGFRRGSYLYTGSAKRGLNQRIARHLSRHKRCRWHIDALTSAAPVSVLLIDPSWLWTECERNRMVQALPGATVPIPGFGASDCRCRSHLTYFAGRPTRRQLSVLAGGHGIYRLLPAGEPVVQVGPPRR